MQAIPILPWLILAAIVGAALMLLRRPGKRTNQDTPACGQCGYCVRGLPTFTCPECGSDLREVGIVRPDMRRGLGAGWRMILWTLVLSITALMISVPVSNALGPKAVTYGFGRDFHYQTTNREISFAVAMNGKGLIWPWETREPSVQAMYIIISGHADRSMRIDLTTRVCTYTDRQDNVVTVDKGLDEQVLQDWLASIDIKLNNPAAAEQLTSFLNECAETPELLLHPSDVLAAFESGTLKTSSSNRARGVARVKSLWIMIPLCAFWVLIWLLGIRRIRRHHSRAPVAESSSQNQ